MPKRILEADPTEIVSALRAVLKLGYDGKSAVPKPESVLPYTEIAARCLALLGVEDLIAVSDQLLQRRHSELEGVLSNLMMHAANDALKYGDDAFRKDVFVRLRSHVPNDAGVRIELSRFHFAEGDWVALVDILDTIVEPLCRLPAIFMPDVGNLITAATHLGRFHLVSSIKSLIDARVDGGPVPGRPRALMERVELLQRIGMEASELERLHNDPASASYLRVLLAIDEWTMVTELEAYGSPPSLELAAVAAGMIYKCGWTRAYRLAICRVAEMVARSGDLETARRELKRRFFPMSGFRAFASLARQLQSTQFAADADQAAVTRLLAAPEFERADVSKLPEAGYSDALIGFHAAPTLEAARHVWQAAFDSARFPEFLRNSPISGDDGAIKSAEALERASVAPEGAPLWLIMTWRADATRMLRLMAAYVGPRTTIIVSIGGDGRPADLARASALLLIDNAHFYCRPTVAWGGQKLLFQNVLNIMQVFRDSAPRDAWMQIVCDRSYPTMGLGRIRASAREGPSGLLRFGHIFGPPAWHKEWAEDVVADLPDIYNSAMDEILETAQPSQFLKLATRSPYWGESDHRLNQSHFNLSSGSKIVGGDARTLAHKYAVAPFQQDTRWLSFARLQEFVDTSTEHDGWTFARRLHPMASRWVHKTLSDLEMHHGDPFIFCDHEYIDFVTTDRRVPEIFVAMNFGFGPEMNFFDTIAVSFKMREHLVHHYVRLNQEYANDQLIPEVIYQADTHGRAFVRKVDPAHGTGLIHFLAERILADDLSEDFYWVSTDRSARSSRPPIPTIDQSLIEALTDVGIVFRDFLGRSVRDAVFRSDRTITAPSGEHLADWVHERSGLTVRFVDHGEKRYESVASDGLVLSFPPSELVAKYTDWGVFIDVELSKLKQDPRATRLGREHIIDAISPVRRWVGSRNRDAAILAALTQDDETTPVPAVACNGGVYEVRKIADEFVMLASVDGAPALLRLDGFAEADSQFAVVLARATPTQAEGWNHAELAVPPAFLTIDSLVGPWRLRVLEGEMILNFVSDGGVLNEEGKPVGRWLLRSDGLQLIGISGMRFGLASQYRFRNHAWRLSGWGWKNIRDLATFSLEQVVG